MARIRKGILGGFSGTVGAVVGVHWRGKDIIRSRPARGSSNPTEPQLGQRMKFAESSRTLDKIPAIQMVCFLFIPPPSGASGIGFSCD